MKILYSNISKTITEHNALFVEKGLIPPATIDLYAGQPEAPEMFSFVTPALFIEYNIEWEHGNTYVKRGRFVLNVHVLIDPLPGMDNYNMQQTDGQKKIEYYDLITHLLDGLNCETTGTISLVKEVAHSVGFYNYQILEFTGMIYRNGRSSLTKHPVPPNLSLTE